jgi:DNA-binding protein Fis
MEFNLNPGKTFQKEDILEYYGQDVGFANQKTNWACLVTSISNLLKKYKIKDKNGQDVVNEATFINFKGGYQYSDANTAQGKYMDGNNFNSGTFFAAAPSLLGGKFTRTRKNIDTATSQQDVYNAYKKTLSSIKQPMIIRVAGCSRRSRGHFVVMVGITKQGEIIVRDCSNSKVAKADRTYTAGRMLASKEQESGNNFDIMYFTK